MDTNQKRIQQIYQQLLSGIEHGAGSAIVSVRREQETEPRVFLVESALEAMSLLEVSASVGITQVITLGIDEDQARQSSDGGRPRVLGTVPSFEDEAESLLNGPEEPLDELLGWLPPRDSAIETLPQRLPGALLRLAVDEVIDRHLTSGQLLVEEDDSRAVYRYSCFQEVTEGWLVSLDQEMDDDTWLRSTFWFETSGDLKTACEDQIWWPGIGNETVESHSYDGTLVKIRQCTQERPWRLEPTIPVQYELEDREEGGILM